MNRLRRILFHFPADGQLTRGWWLRTALLNAGIILIALALAQLIPVRGENPPVLREPVWSDAEVRELAVRACFDCHSNETEWPAYSRVAPLSWTIVYDVSTGRDDLNFSEWDKHAGPEIDPDDPFPPKTLTERIADEIRAGTMPPGLYRLLHPDARLTEAEQERLIEGLSALIAENKD